MNTEEQNIDENVLNTEKEHFFSVTDEAENLKKEFIDMPQSVDEIGIELLSDQNIDYSGFSKKELLEEVIKLKNNSLSETSKTQLAQLKESFEIVFNHEKEQAKLAFLADGGEKDGFEYQDIEAKLFFDALKEINEIKRKQKQLLEEQKIANSRKKKQLLDQIRLLIDGEETESTFKQVKEIQKAWKETGAVSQTDFYELNANYNALLNRYYSFRSIYFDLKNLDKGKNLTQKNLLVAEVLSLLSYENTLDAVKKLNEIHAIYKNLGPVPEDSSEALWQRFKDATDQVRDKRAAHVESFKLQLEANLELKKSLLPKIEAYAYVKANNAKEWITLTEELLILQNEWKSIGLAPENNKKDINDAFWAYCRAFFNNKNTFFGGLDLERKENHKKKLALIEKVKVLKNTEDIKKGADEIKKIQEDWKKIGQSPRAVHESIYQEFRAECDYFFSRRSEMFEARDLEFETNLLKKREVCVLISELNPDSNTAEFENLLTEFFAVGFVPKEKVLGVQKEFIKVTELYISNLKNLSEQELQALKLRIELGSIKGTSAEREFIITKTKTLRNKISGIQDEISTLNNNVEFFANSKSFASIKTEVETKIAILNKEVDKIKEQLKILKIQE